MVTGQSGHIQPLDFSFKSLTEIETIRTETPRRGVKSYKSKVGRFSTSSLRLNNNFIKHLDGIQSIIYDMIDEPEKLTWLDLSFNKLVALPDELAHLVSLKIIYLHGNQLADLVAVVKPLRHLPELYSITLHGNPIEQRHNYRNRIIAALPHIKSLDFNNVTSADRRKLENVYKRTHHATP